MKKIILLLPVIWLLLLMAFLFSGCVRKSKRIEVVPQAIAPPPASVAIVEDSVPAQPGVVPSTPPNSISKTFPEPEPVELSPGAAEIAKLAEFGIDEKVMLAFVENYDGGFELTAPSIVFLGDLGIPEPVIAAMIRHNSVAEPSIPIVTEEAGLKAPETNNVAIASIPLTEGGQPTIENQEIAPALAEEAPSVVVAAAPRVEEGMPPPAQIELDSIDPVQSNYFQRSLQPYGRWVDVPGYGLCWQPTAAIVNPYWQPYLDNGCWVSSSSGWYWHSYYSWGWAPFHYGRWHRHPARGWVWLPGSTWGPAWVTWRYSDSYVGWAPLPPGVGYYDGIGLGYRTGNVGIGFNFGLSYVDYGFVPMSHFYGPAPWRYRVPHRSQREFYDRTLIINNYTQRPDHSIVNHGPSRTPGATFRQAGMRKVTIEDVPLNRSSAARPGRMERRGSEVVVFRPEASAWRANNPTENRRQSLRVTSPSKAALESRSSAFDAKSGVSEASSPPPVGATRTRVYRPVDRRSSGASGAASSVIRTPAPRASTVDTGASPRINRPGGAGFDSSLGRSNIETTVTPLQRRDRFQRAPLDSNRSINSLDFNAPVRTDNAFQSRGSGRELSPWPASRVPSTPDISGNVSQRLSRPPSSFDRSNALSNPAGANRGRDPLNEGPAQTSPPRGFSPSNIRTTPLPQRPPPVPIEPSQVTPSPRAPSNVPASRSSRPSREQRSP